MMLLHKLGLGAAGLALLAATAAVAGALMPLSPAEEPKPAPVRKAVAATAAPVPAAQEPAWKADFRNVYGLRDGELVRRVAPPYPDCRAEYFKDQLRELFKRNKIEPTDEQLNKDYTNYFTKFGWKNGWPVDDQTAHSLPVGPHEGGRLMTLLGMTTGFTRTRTDAPDELLDVKVTGDWVVRVGADPAKVAAAVGAILRKDCGLKVSVVVEDAEREVWVLSGKYAAKPLPERKADQLEVYALELGDRKTGGGGSGDLAAMADHVEGWVDSPIVLGKVEGAPKQVEWHFNYRSPATAEQYAADRDAAAVLPNLAAQTGLTAKQEKRKIKVLVVKKS